MSRMSGMSLRSESSFDGMFALSLSLSLSCAALSDKFIGVKECQINH